MIAEGIPDELKRLIPGGSVRLEFADAERLGSAVATFPAGTRDDDALTCRSRATAASTHSGTCSIDSTRSIQVERVSLHTPDLDEVFLT